LAKLGVNASTELVCTIAKRTRRLSRRNSRRSKSTAQGEKEGATVENAKNRDVRKDDNSVGTDRRSTAMAAPTVEETKDQGRECFGCCSTNKIEKAQDPTAFKWKRNYHLEENGYSLNARNQERGG